MGCMRFCEETTHCIDHHNTAHVRNTRRRECEQHQKQQQYTAAAAAAAAAGAEAGDSPPRNFGTATAVVSTASAIRQEEHTYWHWLDEVVTTYSRLFYV